MNPFGTDAETVRYAADQVKLPALAAQLRRIANEMEHNRARHINRCACVEAPHCTHP